MTDFPSHTPRQISKLDELPEKRTVPEPVKRRKPFHAVVGFWIGVVLTIGFYVFIATPWLRSIDEAEAVAYKATWGGSYQCAIVERSVATTSQAVRLDCADKPTPSGESFQVALWLRYSTQPSATVWNSKDGEFFIVGATGNGEATTPPSYFDGSARASMHLIAIPLLFVPWCIGIGLRDRKIDRGY